MLIDILNSLAVIGTLQTLIIMIPSGEKRIPAQWVPMSLLARHREQLAWQPARVAATRRPSHGRRQTLSRR